MNCVGMIFFALALMVEQSRAQDSTIVLHPNGSEDTSMISHHKWVTDLAIGVGYASLTYLCYRTIDDDIAGFFQRNQTNIASSAADIGTRLGLGRTQFIGLAATALYAFPFYKPKMQQTTIIWAGSLIMNSIITDELKKTFQRHRPETGDPYNSFDWRKGPRKNLSFPSAHTSNAFTTATVFASMYRDKKWVPPVAYSLATLVGISRAYKNAHWASDVMVGAGLGYLSAKSMGAIYRFAGKRIRFLPAVNRNIYSLNMTYDLP